MRQWLALSRKELLLLGRDLHGLLVLFAVPTLFVLLMSLALQDAFAPRAESPLALVVDDRDGGRWAQAYAAELTAMTRQAPADAPVARVQLRPGFSAWIDTRVADITDANPPDVAPAYVSVSYPPDIVPTLQVVAGLMLRQALIATQTEALFDAMGRSDAEQNAVLRTLFDPRELVLDERFVTADGRAARRPTSVQQSVPGWLIFAMFFAAIPLATAFVAERQQGSLLRLRVLGVGAATQLASKAAPYYVVNMLQLVLMIAVGLWLVPALGGDRFTTGESPFGLWLIGSATSIAAIGLALCVATAVRTGLQATIAGGALSLLLAAAGGIMVPSMVMPPAMQRLAQMSPMAWSLEGFWDIVLRGGTWQDAVPEAAALLAFGLACGAIAAALFRRAQTSADLLV